LSNGLLQAVGHQQLANGRALAAWDDQARQAVQVPWGADLSNLDARAKLLGRLAKHRGVLGEVALDREDADNES
jgi:hypothetical protein